MIQPSRSRDNPRRVWMIAATLTGVMTVLITIGISATLPPKEFTNSMGMTFARIDPGSFVMGTSEDQLQAIHGGHYAWVKDEIPYHRVQITEPFYMSIFEVTQSQWKEVMGTDPSFFKGDELPVERVSWKDVQTFINKLNQREGWEACALPTEAQWEYAARAGSDTNYHSSNDDSKLGNYAWFSKNSGGQTHPVGGKQPNAWGLYDMLGNVREWVLNRYQKDYYRTWHIHNPQGLANGNYRSIRGGHSTAPSETVRVAYRSYGSSDARGWLTGFRCITSGPPPYR